MGRSDFEQMMNHADHPESVSCSMCARKRMASAYPTPAEAYEAGQRVNPLPEDSPEGRAWREEFNRLVREPISSRTVDLTHVMVEHGVQVDAYRNPAGRRVVTLSVDGATCARVELPDGAFLRLGSGHKLVSNIFEKDGL